ncbi:MAG: LysM peptidoglycan-binding domain-containing protein [Planctomycetes bacterium]|nr:LysM peptidoglycan-binding domain-containing protein [Planctomycetota bacterium]
MDRGVKIAIFVASILSLGLGLIWDQVLSHARVAVDESTKDELAAEVIDARMGSPEIERIEIPEDTGPNFDIKPVQTSAPDRQPEEQPGVTSSWTDYTVQDGDSWWKLAHVVFKDRGLSSSDIMNANKGKVLRPGEVLRVPPSKEALKEGVPPAHTESKKSNAPAAGATEYEVQDGDSWWKIAYVVFKDRKLSTDDLQKANPGVKLVAGKTIKIP